MLNRFYQFADILRRRSLQTNHGRLGEDMAHRYLRGFGCTVVARNYRPPSGRGEIDLVVWHRGKLVFAEVKTRAGTQFGEPEGAVDAEKRGNLTRAARDYARRAGGSVRLETPHYTDFSSFCDPTHKSHLNSFSFRYFGENHGGFGYYSKVKFREISVRVKLLAFWRWLGFEFLVNHFPRYRRFWEHYLCFVVRGKVMEFEFEPVE